eukprot:1545822-Pyramimonas_sp.AAC.1
MLRGARVQIDQSAEAQRPSICPASPQLNSHEPNRAPRNTVSDKLRAPAHTRPQTSPEAVALPSYSTPQVGPKRPRVAQRST